MESSRVFMPLALGLLWVSSSAFGQDFVRGDANASTQVNITDPVYTLAFVFLGGPAPPCMDAADSNDDEAVDLLDAIYTLYWLFLGTAAPPPPTPSSTNYLIPGDCGADPFGAGLACASFPPCP